jgi:carbamoyl-phosphate synthase large subunit
MPAKRVLVTGAGGPSAVSILRAMEDTDVTMLAGDIDPFGAGLYIVEAGHRSILRRGDDPRFTDDLLERCRRDAVDVVVPTVDSELLPLALRREEFAAAGVTLVLSSADTLATCIDKWALVQRCDGHVRVPETVVADENFDPAAVALPVIVKPREGSGSRGIRLIERVEELEALERDGTLLVQEHLPGPEYSLDVLARADGHVAARCTTRRSSTTRARSPG